MANRRQERLTSNQHPQTASSVDDVMRQFRVILDDVLRSGGLTVQQWQQLSEETTEAIQESSKGAGRPTSGSEAKPTPKGIAFLEKLNAARREETDRRSAGSSGQMPERPPQGDSELAGSQKKSDITTEKGDNARVDTQRANLQHPEGENEGEKPSAEQLAAAYQQMLTKVKEAIKVAREEMAASLQSTLSAYDKHLNAYAKTMPQSSLGEKRTLAKWINNELKPRGMALKCPNTGAPSFLQVGTGVDPDIGRFQLYHMEEGKRVITATRTALPELEVTLCDLNPSIQGTGWATAEGHRRRSRGPRGKT